MSATATEPTPVRRDTFRHEALLYDGDDGFLDATVPFLRESLADGEPVLILVSRHKVDLLRSALGGDCELASFADMAEVGLNPARIIPTWREFLDEHAPGGRPVRGIAEPIWSRRSPAELAECQGHELLLNVAFGGGPGSWLLCAYDTATLHPSVLEEARRAHPFVVAGGVHEDSPGWSAEKAPASHLADPLTEPARELAELSFRAGLLSVVREVVAGHATRFGMSPNRVDDLTVAVNEVATNSIAFGGGQGVFRLWREAKAIVCEISDQGRIEDPLVGRVPPCNDAYGGRGLWMANQLCDLVQIRARPSGSVVRLHMYLDVE